MAKKWFVVRTHSQQEDRAARELRQQNFLTFNPQVEILYRRKQDGRLLKRNQALFANYLFVAFDPKRDPWHRIMSTHGVHSFIGYHAGASLPAQIRQKYINELRARLKLDGGVIKMGLSRPKRFTHGQIVQILFGPFRDFAAIVQAHRGYRVEIEVEVFGRKSRFQINQNELAVAA